MQSNGRFIFSVSVLKPTSRHSELRDIEVKRDKVSPV